MTKRKSRIYLTGYRGTGKSTVGKLISDELAVQCIDLDDVIESSAGKSIRDIFVEGGESLFRDWETKCLKRVTGEASAAGVVSLGGGAILRRENRDLIRATGVCVWLTAEPQTIADRLFGDQTTGERRPALTELSPVEEIQTLLADREPLYRESADLVLKTDGKTPEQLASDVIAWLEAQGDRSQQ